MTDLKDVNIVNIDWTLAKAEENFAAFDIDGELVFSILPIVTQSCGEWFDIDGNKTRKTNIFPLGRYDVRYDDVRFPNWDELIYSRTHIRHNNDIYEIGEKSIKLDAQFVVDGTNTIIQILPEDTTLVKIEKLTQMQESIQLAINALKEEKTQPDWSKAPDWANWWAVDSEDGDAWFFAEEPILSVVVVEERDGNRFVIYWDSCGYDEINQNRMEIDRDTYPFYKEHNFHRSLTKRPE
jgi:hypothetical protein